MFVFKTLTIFIYYKKVLSTNTPTDVNFKEVINCKTAKLDVLCVSLTVNIGNRFNNNMWKFAAYTSYVYARYSDYFVLIFGSCEFQLGQYSD